MNRVLMVTNLPLKCGGATSAMYTGTVIDATPTRIKQIAFMKLKEILHPFLSWNTKIGIVQVPEDDKEENTPNELQKKIQSKWAHTLAASDCIPSSRFDTTMQGISH